jgi:tRNA pseudouridine38-40 synthase
MVAAVPPLLGTHDFTSFRCVECVAKTPVRTIYQIQVIAVEGGVDLVFEGSSFLMHQVRIMAGTLVEVGRGRRESGSLAGVLQALDRRHAGMTAPPEGLCLEKVWYEARWNLGEPSPFGERDQSR